MGSKWQPVPESYFPFCLRSKGVDWLTGVSLKLPSSEPRATLTLIWQFQLRGHLALSWTASLVPTWPRSLFKCRPSFDGDGWQAAWQEASILDNFFSHRGNAVMLLPKKVGNKHGGGDVTGHPDTVGLNWHTVMFLTRLARKKTTNLDSSMLGLVDPGRKGETRKCC